MRWPATPRRLVQVPSVTGDERAALEVLGRAGRTRSGSTPTCTSTTSPHYVRIRTIPVKKPRALSSSG